jgi:membrane protein YqaA with SNARE-associated domain
MAANVVRCDDDADARGEMHRMEPSDTRSDTRLSTGERALAFAWGFAEATLFFVVPDVLITLLALRGFRRGLVASGHVLAGALVGGALMWAWGANDLPAARAAIDLLPAIGPALMDRIAAELDTSGIACMLAGPFVGVPYKIYAVHAASVGVGLGAFLLMSIPARLPRFVLLAFVAACAGPWIERRTSRRGVIAVWFAVWAVNYTIYWSIMPN